MEARVDLSNGKIYGCQPGTLKYFHEQGHIVFNDTERGVAMNYRADFFLKLCVVLLVIIQMPMFNNFGIKFIMMAFAGLWLYYYFYEEAWCWRFAIWKKRNEKDKSDTHQS
jgi:ABC-type transport system involved in Fe-S cluster assembly fused permease/ATPase subunit